MLISSSEFQRRYFWNDQIVPQQEDLPYNKRMKNKLYLVISWLITLLIPFILIGLGIRVLLTPLFPNIEYRMPYFPPDIYGFSTQDRLHWGMDGINYLLNSADVSYLGDLKLSDGTPLFTEPELSHMHDVKVVVQNFLKIWYIVIVVLILLGVWAWRGKWWSAYSQGLRRGGWLTLRAGADHRRHRHHRREWKRRHVLEFLRRFPSSIFSRQLVAVPRLQTR